MTREELEIRAKEEIKHGMWAFLWHEDRWCAVGRISVQKGKGSEEVVFLCQNTTEGMECGNRLGHKFSWALYEVSKDGEVLIHTALKHLIIIDDIFPPKEKKKLYEEF